jgi:asparagine synthase (glutamine-hydrolysing)
LELPIHLRIGPQRCYRLCNDDAYFYVMCGINGIYFKTRSGQGERLVSSMCDAMAHRGPDAEGIYHSEGIALGHRRLAIIDLSEAGVQPFYSADKRYVMVFNGEIYNYRELRNELAEHHFTTDTDTEVLLALWIKWGIEGVHRLNGMFAFAVYDTQEHALHIVRDRLGIKPLYIYEDDHQLLFSSEIRALLATGKVPREMDRDALGEYIRYQTVYAPRTIIKNVSMLMPGQVLSLTSDRRFV